MRPKRLISLLVAVCMMVAMLPFSAVPAFAADTLSFTIDDIQYTIDKNDSTAVSVTGTTGYGDINNKKDLVLPETVEYNGVTYTVTSIGKGAFARKKWSKQYCDSEYGCSDCRKCICEQLGTCKH